MLVYWPGTYIGNTQRIQSAEIHTALKGFNITEVGKTQGKKIFNNFYKYIKLSARNVRAHAHKTVT